MTRAARFTIAAFAAALLVLAGWAYRHYETPILMYHHVDIPAGESSLYVTPESFERQMEFLKIHGYHVIPLEELAQAFKANRRPRAKTVVITFDDGNRDNFKHAFPVLKKMGFPATIFVITENIGKEGWLTEEDLRILEDGGVTIGSHTVTHAYLPRLGADEIRAELENSKKKLELILGHPVTLFSYPAGGSTPEIAELVASAGYACAVTTNYGRRKDDPYRLHRVKIKDAGGSLFSFWFKVSGLQAVGKKRIEPGQ